MAVDIFNTDGVADPTGIVKHGSIIVNAGVIPSRILKNNDVVFNKPVIDDIQDKYDAKFDNPQYYKQNGIILDGTNYLYANDLSHATTFCLAIKFKADAVSGKQLLIGHVTPSDGRVVLMLEDSTLVSATGNSTGNTQRRTDGLGTVVAGRWHIGFGSWKSNTELWCSLDGEAVRKGSPQDGNFPGATLTQTFIGAKNSSLGEAFSGQIAWVATWNLQYAVANALNSADIDLFKNIKQDPRTLSDAPVFYQDLSARIINGPKQIGFNIALLS